MTSHILSQLHTKPRRPDIHFAITSSHDRQAGHWEEGSLFALLPSHRRLSWHLHSKSTCEPNIRAKGTISSRRGADRLQTHHDTNTQFADNSLTRRVLCAVKPSTPGSSLYKPDAAW